MRVLVTGVSGFSGHHLAGRLLEQGFDVIAHSRSRKARIEPPEKGGKLTLISGDLSAPDPLDTPFDAVVHIAGASAEDMERDNIAATRNLLDQAIAAGAKTFVLFSAMSVFGDISAAVVDETTAINDPAPYGASKLQCEIMLGECADDIAGVSLRLPGLIGRGAHRNWLARTLETIRGGGDVKAYGLDQAFNNAVHVSDLGDFVAKLLEIPMDAYDMLTLGAAGQQSIRAIIESIVAITASSSQIIEDQSDPASSFTISSDRAARTYGYAPMEIGEMIERYVREETGNSA